MLSVSRFAPNLFLTGDDFDLASAQKAKRLDFDGSPSRGMDTASRLPQGITMLPNQRLLEGISMTPAATTPPKKASKIFETDKSLPSLRAAGSRLLNDIGERKVDLPHNERLQTPDYTAHKRFVDKKLETLLTYMQQLSSVHGLSLQECLANLIAKPMPKYSELSGLNPSKHWSILRKLFDEICEEVTVRHHKLVEEEGKLISLKKKHETVLADRTYIFGRLAEIIQNRREADTFKETEKKAGSLLAQSAAIIAGLPKEKGLLQRKARSLLEQKYASEWKDLRLPTIKPSKKHKVEHLQEPRDFWKDYSSFSKYDPNYKPAFVRKPRKLKPPAHKRQSSEVTA